MEAMIGVWTHIRLLLDIWSIKALVSPFGGELLDSHLFFYHRYSELADYHRLRGRLAKAERLDGIAELHYQAAPGDEEPPPEAAAAAMPVPTSPIMTNAVSTSRIDQPRVGRSSDLVPATVS
jgi:hypothetical protein